MSESHPPPFPTALVLDTSFLRTIGGTGSDAYQTFIEYVRTKDRELYLSNGVVEELTEQRGYITATSPVHRRQPVREPHRRAQPGLARFVRHRRHTEPAR